MISVENNGKKAVVIYHDNCVDGFASAWAFHALKEKDYASVEYVAAKYGDDPVLITFESNVYILDFSFSREQILGISRRVNHVTILDHHKTAAADLENWTEKPSNVTIVFDMNRSGAGITWDYFCDLNVPISLLISYVQDRDLWKFSLPDSKEINALISLTPKNFQAYTNLSANWNNEKYKDIGTYLSLQHQQSCESIVLDSRPITIYTPEGEFHGRACNCTGQFSSEVGNLLSLSGNDFGATYFSNGKGEVKWSLRSIGSYDVSAIAKCFGGGGHKNAAGFTVHLNLEEGVDPSVIELRTV